MHRWPSSRRLCTVMPCLGLSQSPRAKSVFPNQLCRYGYVTNSKVKFVMVVDSSNTALRDNEIRSVSVGAGGRTWPLGFPSLFRNAEKPERGSSCVYLHM